MESLRNFQRAARRVKNPLSLAERTEEKGDDDEGHSLARRLGLFDMILIGIGASIGAGIFVVTGTVALDAGPAVVLSFILAGAACIINALCYAELANRFPALVGGAYLYSYSAFNELTAFLVFVHLMLDYHIGAASIIRSLADYLVTIIETIPGVESIPLIFGPGGVQFLGGWVSINILAPTLLAILTLVLCQGVRESAVVNDVMTVTKIAIVVLVVIAGAFQVDTSNWHPFVPNGFEAVVQGATVVFFAYVGFDAVANSAEESKNPQRDLPIAIIVSLLACMTLYVTVSLVVTGMVPYFELDEAAPLASAFIARGMTSISLLISIGAVAGLTTTVLVGLYVQSRLYLGLGRDGLLPSFFSKLHPEHLTPVAAQIWVGVVAGILALFIDVSHLSHILSVGTLTGYSVVCGCVLMLRIAPEEQVRQAGNDWLFKYATRSQAAAACMSIIAVLGFAAGLCYRLETHSAFEISLALLAVLVAVPMYTHQELVRPTGFSCPAVPGLPLLGIFFNMALFAQLHYEAWIRFGVVTALAVIVYALYGQFHSKTDTVVAGRAAEYRKAPVIDVDDPADFDH